MNGAGETPPSKNAATTNAAIASAASNSGAGAGASSAAPSTPGGVRRTGPMPNFVSVAKAYMFQQEIDQCLIVTGVSPAREDNLRLAGVQWIENVRRVLKL